MSARRNSTALRAGSSALRAGSSALRAGFRALCAGALLLPPACRSPRVPDVEPALEVPERWSAVDGETGHHQRWWESFGVASLDDLVDEALRENRDLASSWARLDAALTEARIVGADLLPSASAGLNASRTKNVFVGLPVPGGPDVLTSRFDSYGVSLDVSWELDLWGRLAARRDAASQDFAATLGEHRGAMLSITAQTVKAWLAWREAALQAELAGRTVESFRRSSEIVQRRYDAGSASALDVHRSKSLLAGAEANGAARHEAGERRVRQLEILLGRHPSGALSANEPLPSPGPLPAAGVPAELLERRPDLQAERARLRATDLRLDEARAALLPRLTLTGSAGRTSADVPDLGDDDFTTWGIAAGLLQPIFQGGRLRRGVELAEARLRAAAESYAAALLRAFGEVETLLAIETALQRRTETLQVASDEAASAARLAQERYGAGLTDLTTLLDAQRTELEAESQLLVARLAHLEARVDLYLALGGGFE